MKLVTISRFTAQAAILSAITFFASTNFAQSSQTTVPSTKPSTGQGLRDGNRQHNLHGALFLHRLIRDDKFRARVESKMSPADASTFETTLADAKTHMEALKGVRAQYKTAREAHDTLAARQSFQLMVTHAPAVMSDAKIIRDLMKKYRPAHSQSGAASNSSDNVLSVEPLYPNPYRVGGDAPNVRYNLASDASVRVAIVDGHGNMIQNLVDESQTTGEHTVSIPTGSLKPGAYFVQIQTGSETKTTKLMVIQ